MILAKKFSIFYIMLQFLALDFCQNHVHIGLLLDESKISKIYLIINILASDYLFSTHYDSVCLHG